MEFADVLHALVNQTQWHPDSAENSWRLAEAHNAVDAAAGYLNAPAGEVPIRPYDGAVPNIDIDTVTRLTEQLREATLTLQRQQEALQALQASQAEAQPVPEAPVAPFVPSPPAAEVTVPQFLTPPTVPPV